MPRPNDKERARQFANNWLTVVKKVGKKWADPLISTSPWDDAVLEWWKDPRKITLYFQPDGKVSYLKIWGPHMEEMEAGCLTKNVLTPSVYDFLWDWLQEA